MRFRVDLDAFCGPLDLLLYLVRRQELDVFDIPIALVAQQYLEVLAAVEQLDVDAVGDFLELATRLMEIKSQLMLPPREETEEEPRIEDPRRDLVRRLLDYKRFKEAAGLLDERARQWQLRFARRADDLAHPAATPGEQPLQEIDLWDLVSAFARVLKRQAPPPTASIRYDDTPIEVYMQRICDRLVHEPRLQLTDLFEAGMSRIQFVGVFLALLELVRDARIHIEQAELFGGIWVTAAPAAAATDAAA